jgi:hypothetical protein
MKRNIGSLDRTIRIVVGIFLIALVFWGPKSPWGWLGLIPLITAIIGYCPPYQLLGISTCRSKPK